MIEVVHAKPGDIGAIVGMINSLLTSAKTSRFFSSSDEDIASMVDVGIAHHDSGCSLLAMDGDKKAGCMVGLVSFNPFCTSMRFAQEFVLWVEPSYRNRGVASMLVDRFIEWARSHGMQAVCSGCTVGLSDEHIDRLLRSRGFEPAELHYARRL